MRRLYWYDAVILRLVLDDFSRLLILLNFIGPTIRIGREIQCLPYAGFFILTYIFWRKLRFHNYAITMGPIVMA